MRRFPAWPAGSAGTYVIALTMAFAAPACGQPSRETGTLLVVYLEVADGVSQEVELVLDKARLAGEKDTLEFGALPKSLVATKGPGRQFLLWEQTVPAGHYASLNLHFESISAYAQAARIQPLPPSGGLTIPLDLSASAGAPAPIFLFWNPAADVLSNKVYTPSIKAGREVRMPPASLAIVSNSGSHYLTCIDRFRHRVVDVIASGRQPSDMIFSPMRGEFYVANTASDDISVVNLHAGRVERTVNLRAGDGPARLALSPDQQRLYVLNGGSRCVSVLNLLSHQEEGRVNLASAPTALAVDDRNGAVYVTSRESDQLSAIDPLSLTVAPLLNLGAASLEIAFNPRERRLYVEKAGQRRIAILDLHGNAVTGNLRLCAPSAGFAFQAGTRTLFASLPACGLISILKPDENLELGTLPLPHAPGRISLDPESKDLLVPFPAEGQIAFYNADSWKRQALIDVGKLPFAVAFAQ